MGQRIEEPQPASAGRAFAREIAACVVEDLIRRGLLQGAEDENVGRLDMPRIGLSQRWWDRFAGKPDGFPVFKNGRALKAKRSAVQSTAERQRVLRVQPAIEDSDSDEDLRALRAAGGVTK